MRRTEDVPIMEPAGNEDKIESAVTAVEGALLVSLLVVVDSVILFASDAFEDCRRTSASRGSSRGKIAPMVRLGGSCVGMSV